MEPLEALDRIAFLLERSQAPTYKVEAFRRATDVIREIDPAELRRRAEQGTLRELPGIGDTTARVVTEALAGETPSYLERLEQDAAATDPDTEGPGADVRAWLRGDLHMHSDWSDGGSPVERMARTAAELGHEYLAMTDHSPRLTIAHGLSADRLREQLVLLIQRAVLEDVDLDPAQDPQRRELLVQPVHQLQLLAQPVRAQAVRDGQAR